MNTTLFRHKQSSDRKKEQGAYEVKPVYEVEIRFSKGKGYSLGHIINKIGSIGWAVAVPAALCMALGLWMDTLWPSAHSFFAISMPIGLVLGLLTAIVWVTQE